MVKNGNLTNKIIQSVNHEVSGQIEKDKALFLGEERVESFIKNYPDQKQNMVEHMDKGFASIVEKYKDPQIITSGLEFEFNMLERLDQAGVSNYKKVFAEVVDEAKAFKSPLLPFLKNSQSLIENDLNQKVISKLNDEIASKVENFVYGNIKKSLGNDRQTVLIDTFKKVNYIKKLQQLVKSSGDIFGNLFSIGQGQMEKINFKEIEKYFNYLKDNKSLEELANVLGRFGLSYKKFDGEKLQEVKFKSKTKLDDYHPEEIVGITISNDLEHVLPYEIANLSDPLLRNVFVNKYIEKKLTTFHLSSRKDDVTFKKVADSDNQVTKVEDNRGPFVICIDTSNSMNGKPEMVAKALTMGIVRIAKKQKRKFSLIMFGSKIEEISLDGITDDITALMEFLTKSFRGGTDIDEAIKAATLRMVSDEYANSDLLVISDFDVDGLDQAMVNRIELLKHQGNRFHAMVINIARPHRGLLSLFNYNWEYDVHTDNNDEMIRKLEAELNVNPILATQPHQDRTI